jgi:uncharacterized protein
MKRIFRIIPLLCILLLFSLFIRPSESNSQSQKNFLWRVQSSNATAYILGSIHLMKPDSYPLSSAIEDAFAKSDTLAVEADINDLSKLDLQKLISSAFYAGGDTVDKHVSGGTFSVITKEAQRIGFTMELVMPQKPWFLGLTFTTYELLRLGYDPNYGIDKHFLMKAQGKKRIVELENIDYQINLLSGLSDEEQEAFLLYNLRDLAVLGQEIDRLVKGWKSGNIAAVESIMKKSVADDRRFRSIYEKLISVRNRNMAAKIEGYLKTRGTYFVVIGAGHLVGSDGIIHLLERKGYSVEQL